MRNILAILAVLVLLGGCNWWTDRDDDIDAIDGNGTGSTQETGASTLETFGSADDLKSYFASVATTGDGNSQPRQDATFDDDWEGTGEATGGDGLADDDTAAAPDAAPGGQDTNDFSGTTTQEEGVQEADIVKNDGTYIYVLTEDRLRIVQANPGEQMQEVGGHELDGWGQDLYKLPDSASVATRIVAITHADPLYGERPAGEGEVVIAQVEPEIAPCWFSVPRTVVTVLDISDHANPVVESTTTFEAELANSRMIEDVLYMVLVNYPSYEAVEAAADPEAIDLDAVLPDYNVVASNGAATSGNIVEWDGFYRPTDPDGLGMTTIVTMPVDNPADFTAAAIVAYPGDLYASTQAIYLTDTNYNFYTGDYRETTDIYKFAYTEGSVELVATGSVYGRVLNQYSMGEYEGHLRIATTISSAWFSDGVIPSVNNLYVLGEQDGELVVTGSVKNLAPGEEIKSARFIGPRGYLVTFEQIDPLFTFDLSDPANPVMVGELKVPGFSSFIVPMGDNHLLTVGRDVSLEWGWAMEVGVQLSIFDISNFADPQLLHKEIIGSEGTYSEAVNNPKAFTYFAARDLLALPIQVDSWMWFEDDSSGDEDVIAEGGDGSDIAAEQVGASQACGEVEPGFNGVYVYHVTPEAGFEYLGKMATRPEDGDDYWWSYSWFSRGVFMGDNVYAVNERGVAGAPITDVDSAPWRVEFPSEEPTPPVPDDIGTTGPFDGDDEEDSEVEDL